MIKSIKVLGLAIVAVLAFGAIAAASASALEYKANKFPVSFEGGKTEEGKLETVSTTKKRTIKCSADTNKGQIVNASSIGKLIVTFTGCKAKIPFFSLEVSCQSTGAKNAGEIVTNELSGKLGYGLPATTPPVVTTLTPAAGGNFTPTIKCSTEEMNVRGGTIGTLSPINTVTNKFTLKLAQASGVQEYTEYAEESGGVMHPLILETEGKGSEVFAWEQSGVSNGTNGDSETSAENIEIKG